MIASTEHSAPGKGVPMRQRSKGISLIDVMIVLATLAVIAVLVVPQYNEKKARQRRAAQVAEARSHLLQIKLAEERFFEKFGRFTDQLSELASIDPAVSSLVCPFDGKPYEIRTDTTYLQIKSRTADVGAIEGGVPTWLAEPGQEMLRAELIRRSRERMERVKEALDTYKAVRGTYTDNLDSLEAVAPGVKNLLCPLIMKRYSIILSDTAGYEITSHLDEVGRIVGGRPEYPPLPTPKR